MATKRIIEYGLDYYELDQDIFEPDELFYSRVWYILNNLDKNDFETLVKKSRMEINKQYYECEYAKLSP